jgi:hypothetical protein
MQRRKYLAALGSLAAGGATLVGTGAVETISTDRQLAVDVAGDASAYLGINANDDSQFVNVGSNNKLISLDFSTDSSNGGTGVNNEGSTEVRPAFHLSNQSDRALYVAVNNPLQNDDISTTQNNTTGFTGGGVSVPAGIDFQFAASTAAPQFNSNEVGLIGRDDAPSPGNNYGTPSDPSTIALDAGASFPYNYIELDDTGYIGIPPGNSVPITVRVVTDGFDVANSSVPNTRFLIQATTDEDELKIGENITSKIGLPTTSSGSP